MRRSVLLMILLASLFWQAATHGAAGGGFAGGHDLGHAVLHWQDEAHHHHDDGSHALDDAQESVTHVQFDAAVSCTALLGTVGWQLPAAPALAPTGPSARLAPAPALEGLRRPPRVLA